MWIWILAAILVLIILSMFGAAAYFFKYTMVRADQSKTEKGYEQPDSSWHPYRERMKAAQEWIAANTEEHVSITSFDGLKLSALYIPSQLKQPRGTMIVFHGYRSLATVDFALEAEFLHSLGYRLLIPYQRSHGESEGKYITYGVNERFDCRDWAKYAEKRFGGDIFLAGISMGSATVMMASNLDLPESVRGIIADCGFTSPWEIISYVGRRDYKLPMQPLLCLVNCFARVCAGVSLKGADARTALSQTKLPVLFIHGESDDFVPLSMTRKNYKACAGEKELYLVKTAAHAQSYAEDTSGCQNVIKAFLAKHASVW